MEMFKYKKSADILSLSASFTDFTYKKHAHEEYAVGVTLRGIQQYHLDGHYQASHRSGVMLFNREQYHDGSSFDREGIDYVMLYIHPELCSEILGTKELRFSTPIVYDIRLARHILNLNRAIHSGREESLVSELTYRLLHTLSGVDGEAVVWNRAKDTMFVSHVKDMMHANIHDVLHLETVSQEFGMSKYQFIREFRSQTGISPYQFFLNIKVEHARQLIERSRDVYTAVAGCGFVDLTHMNKHFKRMFGVTAYEYSMQL